MSAPRDYQLFLRDMLREARLAQQFLDRISYDQFLTNAQKRRAVECSLVWIGQAARDIPNYIREGRGAADWGELTMTHKNLVSK